MIRASASDGHLGGGRGPDSGMTLVEVMLVVFIIGLVSTLVVLTLPQRPTPERRAAESFSATIRTAQDRAMLTGQPVAIELFEDRYTIATWSDNSWTPVGRTEFLPASVNLDLYYDREFDDAEDSDWPALVLDPSGIVTPVRFDISGRQERLDVSLTESGEVLIDVR